MSDVAPGPMTDVGRHRAAVAALPGDLDALVEVVQGLVVHEHLAAAYGVTISDEARDAVNERRAEAVLDRILVLDDRALDQRRPAERRVVGNCRQFTVLLVALLRAHGLPARARCGFGAYFLPDSYEDHWVAERWDEAAGRWTLVDAQLDERQRGWFAVDFPITDVPRDRFVVAGDAWTRCRAGEADPDRFGLSLVDEAGLWWVAANLMRDAASLLDVPLLPWDIWAAMPTPESVIDDEMGALFDRLAVLTDDPDTHRAALAGLVDGDSRLRVPPTVFNVQHGRNEPV